MFIDATQYGDKIYTWVRDENGKLSFLEDKVNYYLYTTTKENTGLKSIYGHNLKKKTFDTSGKYYDYLKKGRLTFEGDFSPLYKYLSDNFYKVGDNFPVNIAFFDIESFVDFSLNRGYPTADNPYGEINGLSLFDYKNKKYHMLTLDKDDVFNFKIKDNNENHEVVMYYCVTEKQLLDTFFDLIRDIDVLVSWNGTYFDIPYIVERCKILYKNKWRTKLCRNKFKLRVKEDDYDRWGNPCKTYKLVGRIHLDLQELYRKFVPKVQPSYSLDYISKKEIKEEKVNYSGDLGKLYLEDPVKFYEYSLQDTRLLYLLEKKLKFVDLAISMGRRATIRFDEVTGSMKYLEHAIRNYCHYDRPEPLVLPEKKKDTVKEAFDGGYVNPTKPGLYNWLMTVDLASLYPSVIRSLNISPESHVFQCKGKFKDLVKINKKTEDDITLITIENNEIGEEIVMKAYEVYDFIRHNKLYITANGSIMVNSRGILPEILDVWYAERKEMKGKMLKHKSAGEKELADFFNIRQNLAKISLNSVYGATGNKFFRLFSIFLAESVTLTGQMVNKYQIWKADQLIKSKVIT